MALVWVDRQWLFRWSDHRNEVDRGHEEARRRRTALSYERARFGLSVDFLLRVLSPSRRCPGVRVLTCLSQGVAVPLLGLRSRFERSDSPISSPCVSSGMGHWRGMV